MKYLMLIINPGSTSTKVALYHNREVIKEQTIRHPAAELESFSTLYGQKDFRKKLIVDFVLESNHSLEDIDVFIGRGGMLKPLKGGTYQINEKMVGELAVGKYGTHASNLGAIIAYELATSQQKQAYIVDPVCIDEMHDLAKVSGLKGIERQSIFHALNQKATARRYAHDMGKHYEDLTMIVIHLGGGISVGLHHKGRVIDVNEALLGDGPFSPERTGTLPAGQLAELCFSGKYTLEEVKKMIAGKGGLMSYLGTSNGLEISNRIHNGDKEAQFYFHAMAYQVAKEIGALYFVSKGKVDAIIATGGLAYNSDLMDLLKQYVNPIKELTIYPGENEMQSLAEGVLRVLEGTEEVQVY